MKTFFLFAFFSVSLSAFAGSDWYKVPVIPAEHMTCEEAMAFYAKYKRIYVIANHKDIVPIYGPKPRAEWRTLHCKGRSRLAFYWHATKDEKYCYIGAYCQ